MTGDADFDREVMEQIKHGWIHRNKHARREALADFPELAKMGLSIDDTYEPDPDDMKDFEHAWFNQTDDQPCDPAGTEEETRPS